MCVLSSYDTYLHGNTHPVWRLHHLWAHKQSDNVTPSICPRHECALHEETTAHNQKQIRQEQSSDLKASSKLF